MTEEEYLFVTDVADKKRTARGSYNRRAHAGKGGKIMLPSDYMSNKEIKKMNGEVKTYNIKNPMRYAEFKALPDDLKKQYLTMLRDRYNAGNRAIGKMMGVTDHTISVIARELGVRALKKGDRPFPEWENFSHYGTPEKESHQEKPQNPTEPAGETDWAALLSQANRRIEILEAKLSMVELIFGGMGNEN